MAKEVLIPQLQTPEVINSPKHPPQLIQTTIHPPALEALLSKISPGENQIMRQSKLDTILFRGGYAEKNPPYINPVINPVVHSLDFENLDKISPIFSSTYYNRGVLGRYISRKRRVVLFPETIVLSLISATSDFYTNHDTNSLASHEEFISDFSVYVKIDLINTLIHELEHSFQEPLANWKYLVYLKSFTNSGQKRLSEKEKSAQKKSQDPQLQDLAQKALSTSWLVPEELLISLTRVAQEEYKSIFKKSSRT